MRRFLVLVALLLPAGGCAASRDETWIGKNAGVTIDSSSGAARSTPSR